MRIKKRIEKMTHIHSGDIFLVKWKYTPSMDAPSLLISISKKRIPRAVYRNKVKRWIREAFLPWRKMIPEGIVLVVFVGTMDRDSKKILSASKESPSEITFEKVKSELNYALQKIIELTSKEQQ